MNYAITFPNLEKIFGSCAESFYSGDENQLSGNRRRYCITEKEREIQRLKESGREIERESGGIYMSADILPVY